MGGSRDGSLISRLSWGRRQSIGESNAVARHVRAHPGLAGELWEAISFPDPLVHMRAVDALEKVSVDHPEVLAGHEREILEHLSASELPEVRWHVGQLVPRLQLNEDRLTNAVEVLTRLLADPSRIAQANALQGVVLLAKVHVELSDWAEVVMAAASQSPYASVRARARRIAGSAGAGRKLR